MEEHAIIFHKTHSLIKSLELASGALSKLEPLRHSLEQLSDYAIMARYPGVYTLRLGAEESIRIAEQVRNIIRRELGL